MSAEIVPKQNVYPYPAREVEGDDTIPPGPQVPTFTERQLHNAGYLTMANLPPAKFWNWANIGNIVAVLLFLGAVVGIVWTVGVSYGTKTEQDRQRDTKIEQLELENQRIKATLGLNPPEPTPDPTPKKEKR